MRVFLLPAATALIAMSATSAADPSALDSVEAPRCESTGGEHLAPPGVSAPLARESTCYVEVSEIDAWSGDGDPVLVDVRGGDAYRSVRIPGSISAPVTTLSARTYWAERPLLLVERGYRGTELERACLELRRAGFERAAILEGGVDEWPAKRRGVEGSAKGVASLRSIPPRDLLRQSRFDHWMIVLAGSGDVDQKSGLEPPHSVAIDSSRGEAAFAADLLRELRARSSADRPTYVALVPERPTDRDTIERAIARYRIPHLYWIEGDLAAYRAAFELEQRIARASTAAPAGAPCPGARAAR